MADPSLVRFRKVVAAACDALEARRQEINDLNVFPVADGDTGDNMARTLQAVRTELEQLTADGREPHAIDRDEIVQAVARAALLGARGNSGVILSQIVRGLAEELASRPGELIGPALVAAALGRAADAAYASVREPAEGTMLTVIREVAHRVSHEVAHMENDRLDHGISADDQDAALAALLKSAVQVGEESVKRSPDLLPILRESGVVDSGGYGFVVILSGLLAALGDDSSVVEDVSHHDAPVLNLLENHEEAWASSQYRFCTNFAVLGAEVEPLDMRPGLEAIGDSVLVVGDRATLRVHIHTDAPEKAIKMFENHGEVIEVSIEDMHLQTARRSDRLGRSDAPVVEPATATLGQCGIVAAVSGQGIAKLFRQIGATIVDGGANLNPSTEELLAAINAAPEDEVVVLPNSSNVVLAAEHAAELADKKAVVVATPSQQAGLAIAVAFTGDRTAEQNLAAMEDALNQVREGGVAPAARDDADGRFQVGDAVGFVGGEIISWGDPQETLRSVLHALGTEAELVTCIAGENAPLDDHAIASLVPLDAELELHNGGQSNWWWLISAE